MDILTRPEVEAVGRRAIALTPGAKLDPNSVTNQGSTVNVIVVGCGGALAEEIQRRAYAKIAATRRASAKGSDLDTVIEEDTFGQLPRLGASVSRVEVAISRPSGANPSGTIQTSSTFTFGGVLFALDTPVAFTAGQTGPIYTTATSTTAGASTIVAWSPLTWALWSAPQDLFDTSITIAAISPAVGGADAELDQDYLARSAGWASSIGRGTVAALTQGALTVPGVKKATVIEGIDSSGELTGQVTCYIADANGQANDALCLAVTRELRNWRHAGGPVRVIGSIPTYVSFVLSLAYADGTNIPLAQKQVRAEIVSVMSGLAPGVRLYRSNIAGAIKSVSGVVVADGAIVAPAGDMIPDAGQSYRTTIDMVTFQ